MALLRTLHAWVGAGLSLILLVLGLTGAFLVYKTEFLRLTVPEARAQAPATAQTLGAALEVLERSHAGHLRRVVFPAPELGIHQIYFADQSQGYAAADGRLIAQWSGPARPETFAYELHHFLLGGDTGMKIVGYSALIGCLLVLTGLIVWAPIWRSWRFRIWPRSTHRRDLVSAHRELGVVFALPILLFCLTGAMIIFYQTSQKLLVQMLPGPAAEEFFPPADPGDIDWPRALAAAQAKYPDASLRAAIWPEGPWASAIVKVRQPGEWPAEGETEVLIDPATSEVLGVKDAGDLGRGYRVFNGLWPLHTAVVGGRLFDALAALSGLALAALGGVGLWSFVVKPRRKRAPA